MTRRLDLPDFTTLEPDALAQAYLRADTRFRQAAEALAAEENPTFEQHVLPLIQADEAGTESALLAHLSAVADSPEVRTARDIVRKQGVATGTWLMDNEAIYAAYAKVSQREGLDAWQQAWLKLAMRPYEKRGFGLPEDIRSRLAAISERTSDLTTRFERNLQDADRAWHLVLSQEQVAGLPAPALETIAKTGRQWQSPTGFAADLKGPCVSAVLTYCTDRGVREQLWRTNNAKGQSMGPGGVNCDNLPVLLELLALRHESAGLRNHVDCAHVVIEDKMAGSPEAAFGMLHDLRDQVRPAALREWQLLSSFAADELGIEALQPWDVAFAAERQRQAYLGFSTDQVAQYFPLDKAIAGMLDLSSRLFGVQFAPDTTVSTWDPQVRFYRVHENEQVVGGFYLDPFARLGKRQGAWKATLCPRTSDRLPLASLSLNVAEPEAGSVPCLEHSQLVTLFHEFGHGLHLLLGRSPYADTDMSGVERDAIECPSQFLENFAWEPSVLTELSSHCDTQEKLPDELVSALVSSRHHNVGMALVRQMVFGLWDLELHSGPPVSDEAQLWELAHRVREQTHVVPLPDGVEDRTMTAFSHIFSGGYTAGYYGYLWAEVLSADAYAAFAEASDGPISAEQGARFRDEILQVGAMRPFEDSFLAFRGRPPSVHALLKSRGLETSAPRTPKV